MYSTAAWPKAATWAAAYSIADIAVWPWYGQLVRGNLYGAAEFLAVDEYPNVQRWAEEIAQRPAVQRGTREPYLGDDTARCPSAMRADLD
jgi:GST-like protein